MKKLQREFWISSKQLKDLERIGMVGSNFRLYNYKFNSGKIKVKVTFEWENEPKKITVKEFDAVVQKLIGENGVTSIDRIKQELFND